jgi:hypothetical protein
MRRPRSLRTALRLVDEAGLAVADISEGRRHTEVRLIGGGTLLVSRGAKQATHLEFVLRRDLLRLKRMVASAEGATNAG